MQRLCQLNYERGRERERFRGKGDGEAHHTELAQDSGAMDPQLWGDGVPVHGHPRGGALQRSNDGRTNLGTPGKDPQAEMRKRVEEMHLRVIERISTRK
jgi:hypothetical protein